MPCKLPVLCCLLLMAIVFRRGDGANDVKWMHPSWWGILGIIGWSYLVSALVYVLPKEN